jgi:hypothetical protein
VTRLAALLSLVGSAAVFGGCGSSTTLVVNILDPDGADAAGSEDGSLATVSSTAMATMIAAPDYAGVDGVTVQIDATRRVTAVSGALDLTDGSIVGQDYVIDLDTLPDHPTFADVDGVFAAGDKVAVTSNPRIAGSRFLSPGDDLDPVLVRSVIIHREVSGVRSYQVFTLGFHP